MKRLPILTAALILAACKIDARNDYLGDKEPQRFDLGRAASTAQVAAVDIDVAPSGAGLPAGSGTAAQGAPLYATNCASCHGANGEGKPPAYPQLIGGPKGTFDFASDFKIPRTVGNYWPYATTVFDYVRRAMPQMTPGSLTNDQVYAVTAYLLAANRVIPMTATLDSASLSAVKMPYVDRFVRDDRRGGREVK